MMAAALLCPHVLPSPIPQPPPATPQSLLSAVKSSFSVLRRRLASTAVGGVLFLERPLFSMDLQLRVPSVVLSPSLDDVQEAINDTAKKVVGGGPAAAIVPHVLSEVLCGGSWQVACRL